MTSVRVRMYRVGFGDCFLVTFPGPRHVLVDCGSLAVAGREAASGRDAVAAAARDVIRTTGGHLDAVVASHRHRDHVNGFSLAASLWRQVSVGAVWMPWTEDPADAEASAITARLAAVARTLGRLPGARDPALAALLANNQTDPRAMDVLHAGFAANPVRRYLAASPRPLRPAELGGVTVRVLGPGRGTDVLHRLDLESFVALSAADGTTRRESPFGREWQIRPGDARRLFKAEIRRQSPARSLAGRSSTEPLHYWLDQTINNTSLVLLFRAGRARLLFPGDAAWDAWLPILLPRNDTAGELGPISLYKVSHHGSFSGTPQELLARIGGETTSLVSTRPRPWPEIPQRTLLGELGERGRVVRSDRVPRRGGAGITPGPHWVDVEIPT